LPSCLIVQHAAPERPYGLAEALLARGVEVIGRAVFDGEPVPDEAGAFDGVVVMGGPMSARSDDGFPTRRTEMALLADAFRRKVPTLGVCLGAQLLAAAAGGTVCQGEAGPEIGWGPVELAPAADADALLSGTVSPLTVLHWHGDTFSLPPGAVLLASSERYRNQAFRVGPAAWGLQFHIEVDRAAVAAFVAAFGDEAAAAGSDPAVIESRAPGVLEGGDLDPDGGNGHRIAARFAEMVVRAGTGRSAW
jgi:GMP synthase-like glutamine amidotransferase